jgi:hypothetical protein
MPERQYDVVVSRDGSSEEYSRLIHLATVLPSGFTRYRVVWNYQTTNGLGLSRSKYSKRYSSDCFINLLSDNWGGGTDSDYDSILYSQRLSWERDSLPFSICHPDYRYQERYGAIPTINFPRYQLGNYVHKEQREKVTGIGVVNPSHSLHIGKDFIVTQLNKEGYLDLEHGGNYEGTVNYSFTGDTTGSITGTGGEQVLVGGLGGGGTGSFSGGGGGGGKLALETLDVEGLLTDSALTCDIPIGQIECIPDESYSEMSLRWIDDQNRYDLRTCPEFIEIYFPPSARWNYVWLQFFDITTEDVEQ